MKESSLPEPLVPADVDLRGMEYMPFYGDRAFASPTWVGASAEGKVAALRLWWHAFAKEVPAASLPDDNRLLADYAGYGVAVKSWLRVRTEALNGWIQCSDGRLYHTKLALWAIEAWQRRVHDRQRKERWRRGRDGDVDVPGTFQRRGRNADEDISETGTERGKRSEAKRSDFTDREVSSERPTETRDPANGHGAVEKSTSQTRKNGANWDSMPWVTATASTVGIERRTGESDADFKDRTYSAVEERKRQAQLDAVRARA